MQQCLKLNSSITMSYVAYSYRFSYYTSTTEDWELLLCIASIPFSFPHFPLTLFFSVIFDMSFWWQVPWLSLDLGSVINFVSSSFFLFLHPWFQQEPSVLDKVTKITGQGKLIFNVPFKTLPSAWPSEMCDKSLGKLHLCS